MYMPGIVYRLGRVGCVMVMAMALGQAAFAAGDDPVAATVNGEPITRTEILLALEIVPPNYRNLPPEQLFPLIREQLIDIKLLAAKGAEAGLAYDPRIVVRRDFYVLRLTYDYYAASIVAGIMTDDFLQESYQRFLENFPDSEERKISHILVAKQEEAEHVVAVLAGGADFAESARQYSVGPSAPQGGELGFLRREQMVPEFAEVAFALDDGEISAPVKTQFGWHVIRVAERHTLEPPSFAETEQRLRVEITDRLVSEAAKEARETAEIEYFELDEEFFAGATLKP